MHNENRATVSASKESGVRTQTFRLFLPALVSERCLNLGPGPVLVAKTSNQVCKEAARETAHTDGWEKDHWGAEEPPLSRTPCCPAALGCHKLTHYLS